MAYDPDIRLRKVIADENTLKKIGFKPGKKPHYFIKLFNNARSNRPAEPPKKGEDILEERVIKRGMIICVFKDNILTINGYPYYINASLLISKEQRPQERVREEDLESWIKFSILTNQYVFFNSVNAGASRPERFHAQVVNPKYLDENIIFPITDEDIVKNKEIQPGISEVLNYSVYALRFAHKLAPEKISNIVRTLESRGRAYNILITPTDVYLTGRDQKFEKFRGTTLKIGQHEIAGIPILGKTLDENLENTELEKNIGGENLFNKIDFRYIHECLDLCTLKRDEMRDYLILK